ncbi:MAG: hypothetical protein JJU28_20865 [Cyclobacteriaceae bacterium]|nr:hypothetical protein [Cyclobacteriaceae bacterium]
MVYSNLISVNIPDEDLKEILDAIHFIDEKLKDLVALSQEEKAALPKMRQNMVQFVHECLEIAENHPEVVPGDVDVQEIKKDIMLIHSIRRIAIPLNDLIRKLNDSVVLAGSEAYLPSIAIHNSYQTQKCKSKINA